MAEGPVRSLVATQKENALDYCLKHITQEDIPKIMEIRKKMNSHDCFSCLQTWSKLHPEGICVVKDENGHIVGTAAFVHNSDKICTCGLVYVDPKLRRNGIAKEVLQRGVDFNRYKIMCGNSVESMVRFYSKNCQVVPRENFTLLRNSTSNVVNFDLLTEDLPPGVALKPFHDDHLDSVAEYDRKLMSYDRSRLLELSCKEENSRTFVAFNCRKCVGFGSVKLSCLGAARVGPLYADDAIIAEVLLKTLLKSFPQGKGFVITTLSNNVKANSIVAKLALPSTQKLVQVFRKRSVEVDTDKVYAHFDVNFCVF